MTSPLRTPDFFVLEAGEALDGLEALLRADGGPAPDELVRGARLLRGAAVMAGHQPLARAAAALEGWARGYREHPGAWGAPGRENVARAFEEFRALLRQVPSWTDTDTARALRLSRSLELLTGRRADRDGNGGAEDAAGSDGGGALAAGVRAFVAREGALIASALDRAARTLRASPGDREPLYTVIRRMQSLRGLAELGELAPLPEVLDGIETAVGDLTRTFAPPPGVDQVVQAAAQALTRLARDVAEAGRPDPESAETQRFGELLVRVFAVERDVVPIESLYVDGDPEPSHQPAAAAGFRNTAALGPLELVSYGEHFARTADLVARSRSATERDLRLYQLLGTLRSIGSVGPDPVAGALSVFARAVREGLAAGVANRAMGPLVACLRDAGELLRSVADNDNRMLLSRRLLDVAHRLGQLGTAGTETETETVATPSAAADLAHADESDVVPIEQLLLSDSPADELPIVPIESLAPDAEIASRPAAADTPGPLERAFGTYARLRRERSGELPSLAALLRDRDRDRDRDRADSEAPAESPSTVPTDVSDVPVAIGALCYHGRAALERAEEVRRQLAAALAGNSPLPAIRPLLDELLDLVPLALTEH